MVPEAEPPTKAGESKIVCRCASCRNQLHRFYELVADYAAPGDATGETQANAADEGRDVWPRPKIGEKCWIDVELQLVDDNGQLSRNASVRLRSESRRYSTDVKRIEDAKAKAQRRHHFSLLSSTVE